jgi:hypothetical protein
VRVGGGAAAEQSLARREREKRNNKKEAFRNPNPRKNGYFSVRKTKRFLYKYIYYYCIFVLCR